MHDDDREAQHKADRRAPSAGEVYRPRVPPPPAASVPPATPAETRGPIQPPRPVLPAQPTRLVAPPPVPQRPAGPYPRGAGGPAVAPLEAPPEKPPATLVDRLRRLQPVPVVLTVCSIGAFVFLTQAMTSHTTPVAVLMSAGVVSALVFAIDAVAASVGTWRSSRDGDTRRALVLSLVGGFSALLSAGSFGGVLVMILVLNS